MSPFNDCIVYYNTKQAFNLRTSVYPKHKHFINSYFKLIILKIIAKRSSAIIDFEAKPPKNNNRITYYIFFLCLGP